MQHKYYNQSFRLKTQKAIESINNYELIQNQYRSKVHRLAEHIVNKQSYKTIEAGQWIKIQIMQGYQELYQLLYNDLNRYNAEKVPTGEEQSVVLKVIVKNLTGVPVHLALSSKPQKAKLAESQYKITGEKLIKISGPPLVQNKMYLTIHAPADFIVFKMKYQFVSETEELSFSRMKSSSVRLLKLKSHRETSEDHHDQEDRQTILMNLKRVGNRSPRSIILERSRMISARAELVQKERQKFALAQEKKANVQVYKQKSTSLRNLSQKCVGFIKEYEQNIAQSKVRTREAIGNLCRLILVVNFVKESHDEAMERIEGLKHAVKMSCMLKKCMNKWMSIGRQLRVLQPNKGKRQMLAVYYHTTQAARMFLKVDLSQARDIVITCFRQTFVGLHINRLCTQAANYRAKCRTLQRYWKQRNQAQMCSFKQFLQTQIEGLLKKHLYFGLVMDQFHQQKMFFNLSWQYLKQSSLKINAILGAYQAKLAQIEDIKKLNIQNREFNQRALKKYHRKQLEVPSRPSYPVYRYFRDLGILKAMLRSWLQIQYRRHVRRMKKEGKSLPKNMKLK